MGFSGGATRPHKQKARAKPQKKHLSKMCITAKLKQKQFHLAKFWLSSGNSCGNCQTVVMQGTKSSTLKMTGNRKMKNIWGSRIAGQCISSHRKCKHLILQRNIGRLCVTYSAAKNTLKVYLYHSAQQCMCMWLQRRLKHWLLSSFVNWQKWM